MYLRIFYFMEGFSGGESPSGHWFYGLYKHYWFMSSLSFWFARNIWFTKILIYKELWGIIRSIRNCHTGAQLYRHLPSHHICDTLSKHPIWSKVRKSLLLAVMEQSNNCPHDHLTKSADAPAQIMPFPGFMTIWCFSLISQRTSI